MKILLKKKITSITDTLRTHGKNRLATCIEENWDQNAIAYSKHLNLWRPTKPMEKELLEAFGKELERLDMKGIFKSEVLDSLQKRRVLQTAPHLGVTESPRMLCINWIGSLGVPEDESYVVGMFSGVPFSNRSRPGRINMEEKSINLMPSNMQDGLVYRSKVKPKLVETVENLPKNIAKFLPRAVAGSSYTKWALNACQHIERKILHKNNLIYLDINEVVSNYLVEVLQNRFHIMHKIFFDPKCRAEFAKVFPNEILFYTPTLDGKYEKMENMSLVGTKLQKLKSKNREIDLSNSKILIRELKEGRLCPGLLPSFLVLAFLNQFKCFGSFAQVEYLPVYQKKLAKLKFMKPFAVEKIPTSNLTTGVFPENPNLYPADIIAQGKKIKPNPKVLFGEFLIPMKDVLLESYFTGDTRNGKK